MSKSKSKSATKSGSKAVGKPETKISDQTLKKIKKDPKKYAETAPIDEVANTLRQLSWTYYNTGETLVPDEVFDQLKDTLKERDPENAFLHEVGAPIAHGTKVPLPCPLGSLTKIKDSAELASWMTKYKGPYVLSQKLDGVSGLYYKDKEGNLHLYSRGNGLEGQDISHLIKYVIPRTVKRAEIPTDSCIRGEILISKEDFKKVADTMKNARNATSGVVNSKTLDPKVASLCQFVSYNVLRPEHKQDDQMKLMKEYGFKVVPYKVTKELSFEMLSDLLKEWRQTAEFEVDGVVVVDGGKVYPLKEGNPDHAFAFKTVLADQVATTKIKQVIWTPTMDGYLKPSIEIEPIDVSGVTIKSATAFNAKFVVDNKLGPGAVVKIVRSGDVIPHILEVVTPAKEPAMPEVPYNWTESRVDIVLQDIYGAQSDAVTMKLLKHFFTTLGVKHINEGVVTKLVNAGYKTIPSILSADRDDLANIEGLGKKSVDRILDGVVEALKKTDLPTFMDATHTLGRSVGTKKLRLITSAYPNLMNEDWTKSEFKEKVLEVPGFSEITASKVASGFADFKKAFDEINDIIDISHLKEAPAVEAVDEEACVDLKGKSVVFTGFRDKELEEKIVKCGAKVSTAVSSKTFVLIAQDPTSGSGKVSEAREKKVPIMSKDEFLAKYAL